MTPELTQAFFDECSKAFAFLVTDYGYKLPTLEITVHYATVTFIGKHLAIEWCFEEREAWIEGTVARVINGAPAEDYAVDEDGNRVREHLFRMLEKRGVQDFGLRSHNLARKSMAEMFRIKLNTYASLLQKYGQDILNDSPTALAV
ncbi:MAG: hypothetical protein ACREXX_13375 [Gammaproteobacteria bacterium]